MTKSRVKAGPNGKLDRLENHRNRHPLGEVPAINSSLPKGGGTLTAMRISVTSEGDFIARELKKIGIAQKDRNPQNKLNARSVALLNGITTEAWHAVRAKIPLGYKKAPGGDLKDNRVRISGSGAGSQRKFSEGTSTLGLTRSVIVENGPHKTNGYKGYTGPASALANFLDKNKLGRTKTNPGFGRFKGVNKGESTAWKGLAEKDFRYQKSDIIKKLITEFKGKI